MLPTDMFSKYSYKLKLTLLIFSFNYNCIKSIIQFKYWIRFYSQIFSVNQTNCSTMHCSASIACVPGHGSVRRSLSGSPLSRATVRLQ